MKKMIKNSLLICLMLIIGAALLTACGDDSNLQASTTVPTTKAHIHSFGQWTTVKESTCSEKGEQERVCACGEKETQNMDLLAHTEVIDEAVAPSCNETGLTEGKHCLVCNEILLKQEIVEAAHTWSAKYQKDEAGHWRCCDKCGAVSEKMLHTVHLRSDVCDLCKMLHAKGVEYDISEDGTYAKVVGYDGTATRVKIIEEYRGLPVTLIDVWAFREKRITDIFIPDSVTTIGREAFAECRSLISVTIPDSVTTIGLSAFAGCINLTSVSIPSSVTIIGESAFYECYNLTSVVIPDGVTTIGSSAFWGCSKLTSVTIPDSVTAIGGFAFSGCVRLRSAIIPDSVTYIGPGAFRHCDSLTSITIPDSVTTIGSYAFRDCDDLTSVTISNSVTMIPDGMFDGCGKLTSVIIPDSVTTIGGAAFRICSTLTSVVIPNGVTTIGSAAFQYCYNLTSVTIPDSVTTVGPNAFDSCNRLQYTEYENCKYLGNAGNPYLVLITTVSNDPSSYTVHKDTKVIAGAAFADCSNLTSIIIPDGVITIGSSAFYGCAKLTSLTIGSTVTTIGANAFKECIGLITVTLPDSVTAIYNGAFENCSSLTSVTIGNSVNYIGHAVFENCGNLIEIRFNGTKQRWNAIKKEFTWDYCTGEYIVRCTDGYLEKTGW